MANRFKPSIPQKGETKDDIFTIKCALKTIIRPQFQQALMSKITDMSLQATSISVLGSLLFLFVVKKAYESSIENEDFAFFGESGEKKIKLCFNQVLWHNNQPPKQKKTYKYKPQGKKPRGPRAELPRIDPEFKAIIEGLDEYHRIDWPNNNDFSNGLKHLRNQYTDNVVTNSKTHADKHITQYLRLKVFELNTDGGDEAEKFLASDIASVVKLITEQKDIKMQIRDPNKLERCGFLYDMVNDLNVFPRINLHDLTTDTKHWFKAMPMFLSMQREIEEYNSTWPDQRRSKRKKRKRKKSKRRINRKQMLTDPKFRPYIRNLVVVPMCGFRRKHLKIDCTSMYQVLSSQKLLPKVEIEDKNGKTSIATILPKDFNNEHKRDQYWDQYFYMQKIRRFVRGKKKFDHSITTDGIAVSLQYSVKKKTNNKNNESSRIVGMILDGKFDNFAGVDTGVRNWNTTVTHNIINGTEVSFVYIYVVHVPKRNILRKCQHSSTIHFFFLFRETL